MFLKSPFSLSALSQNYNATHTFYATESLNSNTANIIQNGNGFLISTNSQNAKKVLSELNSQNIQGESFCFDGTFCDVQKILYSLNAQIVKKECFDDFQVFYAHSPKISKYILMNFKKVNMQIVLKNNKITVGSPIILGSY